jgi:hypothetical protein
MSDRCLLEFYASFPFLFLSNFFLPFFFFISLFEVVFQLYLTTCCEGLLAATCALGGVQANEVMHNPIFTSNSPSDFWGRKWNSVVHGVLKVTFFIQPKIDLLEKTSTQLVA